MRPRILGWMPRANTPWLGVPRGFTLKRDHWIPGRAWRTWIARAMDEAIPGSSLVVEDRLLVAHRLPAPRDSYALEVYSSAARLGVVEYSPHGSWVFRPSGALASILEGQGFPVVRVEWRGRLKGKKVRVPRGYCDEGEYVLVGSGGFVGPARILDREKCLVRVRDMAPKGFRLLGESTVDDAVSVNRAYVERIAAEAVEFIRREAGDRLYVAVSGGIDSGATLSLAVEALGPSRVTAVYADTGMEFPENLATAERLASQLGVDLVVVESGRDPLEEIRARGLMTRDRRWCTRLLKLAPLARYYKRVNARVVADGARALESDSRALTPRSGVNPLIPFVKRILPIHQWSRLEVQLYTHLRRLPVNLLYDNGLERIGCMVCPAMHLYELRLAESLAPGFYERLYRVLEEMGLGDPRGYILGGSWRTSSG